MCVRACICVYVYMCIQVPAATAATALPPARRTMMRSKLISSGSTVGCKCVGSWPQIACVDPS